LQATLANIEVETSKPFEALERLDISNHNQAKQAIELLRQIPDLDLVLREYFFGEGKSPSDLVMVSYNNENNKIIYTPNTQVKSDLLYLNRITVKIIQIASINGDNNKDGLGAFAKQIDHWSKISKFKTVFELQTFWAICTGVTDIDLSLETGKIAERSYRLNDRLAGMQVRERLFFGNSKFGFEPLTKMYYLVPRENFVSIDSLDSEDQLTTEEQMLYELLALGYTIHYINFRIMHSFGERIRLISKSIIQKLKLECLEGTQANRIYSHAKSSEYYFGTDKAGLGAVDGAGAVTTSGFGALTDVETGAGATTGDAEVWVTDSTTGFGASED
jgi:hypothetical protein